MNVLYGFIYIYILHVYLSWSSDQYIMTLRVCLQHFISRFKARNAVIFCSTQFTHFLTPKPTNPIPSLYPIHVYLWRFCWFAYWGKLLGLAILEFCFCFVSVKSTSFNKIKGKANNTEYPFLLSGFSILTS